MKRLVPILIAALALGCGGSSPDAPSGTDTAEQDSTASSDVDDPVLADSGAPSEQDSTTSSDVEPTLADADVLTEPDSTAPSDVEPVLADTGDPSEPDSTASSDDVAPDEQDVDEQLAADAGSQPLPPGLHGQAPPDALPLPLFVATNYDGSVRGPDDLMGHPTVLWFFPFAGTPG